MTVLKRIERERERERERICSPVVFGGLWLPTERSATSWLSRAKGKHLLFQAPYDDFTMGLSVL